MVQAKKNSGQLSKLLALAATITYLRKKLPRNRSFSKSTIYRMIVAGKFPTPVKIGQNSFWRRKEIDAWVTKLVDGQ